MYLLHITKEEKWLNQGHDTSTRTTPLQELQEEKGIDIIHSWVYW